MVLRRFANSHNESVPVVGDCREPGVALVSTDEFFNFTAGRSLCSVERRRVSDCAVRVWHISGRFPYVDTDCCSNRGPKGHCYSVTVGLLHAK